MKYLLTLPVVMVLVLAFQASAGTEEHPYKIITADELVALKKDQENLVIVDSRGGKYFDGEMIEGAVNLPVNKVNTDELAKIIPSKDTPVAFYCNNVNCPASELSAYKANAAGYTMLYKYPGGIEDWKEKGLPTNK